MCMKLRLVFLHRMFCFISFVALIVIAAVTTHRHHQSDQLVFIAHTSQQHDSERALSRGEFTQ